MTGWAVAKALWRSRRLLTASKKVMRKMEKETIRVLLVEDEATLSMIVKETLETQGFSIETAADGEEGLRKFFVSRPQVLVADVMMPRMDGFEMVRRIRERDRETPVLYLTARSSVNDVVEGFGTGGNDYLRKPFGMQELIVRLRALAARSALHAGEETQGDGGVRMQIGRYRLDVNRQRLAYGERVMELSYRETHILRMLAERKGNVVDTADILHALWGDDSFYNARSLQVFITKLRHKLSLDAAVSIVNVRGIGYRMVVA